MATRPNKRGRIPLGTYGLDELEKDIQKLDVRLTQSEANRILKSVEQYSKTTLLESSKLLLGLSMAHALKLLQNDDADAKTKTEIALKVIGHSAPTERAVFDVENGKDFAPIVINMPRPTK